LDAGARGSQGSTAAAQLQADMGQVPAAIVMPKMAALRDLLGPKANPEWRAKPEQREPLEWPVLQATIPKCKWVWYQDASNANKVPSVHQVHLAHLDYPDCKGCLEIQALEECHRFPEVVEMSVQMVHQGCQGKKDQKAHPELMEPTEKEKQDLKVPQESLALLVQQDPKAKALLLSDHPVQRDHQEVRALPALMEPTAVKEAQELQGAPAQMPNIARVHAEGAFVFISIEKPEELFNMRRAMFCAGLIFIAIHVLLHFVSFDDSVKEKIFLNALVLG